MSLYAVAGTQLYIGGVINVGTTDLTESSFTGQTWVEIKELEGMGQLGDTSAMVTTQLINRARDVMMKGSRSGGTMELVAGIEDTDPGQLALIAAEKTRSAYAFKLTKPDAPVGGTPSMRMFAALVMSANEAFDAANVMMKLNVSLAVNSNIVRIAAEEEE